MAKVIADASPTKGLFLEMFTRDLSLEDCILDLVDNSIDSLARSRSIDVSEALLPAGTAVGEVESPGTDLAPARIDISCDSSSFQISDTCGGISVDHARDEVFRFGHTSSALVGQLGVYGIGLKRAIFKIGKRITIESRTTEDGFRMRIDVPVWADDPAWTLPFDVIEGVPNMTDAGTTITITTFTEEVAERFKSGAFAGRLRDMIARTYCLFLDRYVVVTLNGHRVGPSALPLGSSTEVNVAKEEYERGDVKVTLYASLAARDPEGEWRTADAGWYVACNGRLVVAADRTELTGWGVDGPLFMAKYRGFIGLAFFYSRNPLSLPWTTTKRGLNRESLVFQEARGRMITVGKPVRSFLDAMYTSLEAERGPQRQVAAGIVSLDVREMASKPSEAFAATVSSRAPTTRKVQYDAEDSELDRVRKSLHKRSMSAVKIGRFTFDYYLEAECPE